MSVLSKYYAEIEILATMQLDDPLHPFWEARAIKPRDAELVVYLGCNILRTVNLAEQFVRIVEVIEGGSNQILVLGGPGHCCGSTHLGLRNDKVGAEKRGVRAVETFRSVRPGLVIMWCPVCERRFAEYEGVDLATEAFETIHASEYLARNAHKLRGGGKVKNRRVAVHEHRFDEASARDASNAKKVLSQIPGIELVEGGMFDGFGYQCTAAEAETPNPSYKVALEASLNFARASGADTMVSVYHGCHRALLRGSRNCSDLVCRSFLDPIAEWIGITVPDRYRSFVENGNEEAIWNEVQGRFSPESEPEVRRVIRKHFDVAGLIEVRGDPVQGREPAQSSQR